MRKKSLTQFRFKRFVASFEFKIGCRCFEKGRVMSGNELTSEEGFSPCVWMIHRKSWEIYYIIFRSSGLKMRPLPAKKVRVQATTDSSCFVENSFCADGI